MYLGNNANRTTSNERSKGNICVCVFVCGRVSEWEIEVLITSLC